MLGIAKLAALPRRPGAQAASEGVLSAQSTELGFGEGDGLLVHLHPGGRVGRPQDGAVVWTVALGYLLGTLVAQRRVRPLPAWRY